jgi:hypothetical protein
MQSPVAVSPEAAAVVALVVAVDIEEGSAVVVSIGCMIEDMVIGSRSDR